MEQQEGQSILPVWFGIDAETGERYDDPPDAAPVARGRHRGDRQRRRSWIPPWRPSGSA